MIHLQNISKQYGAKVLFEGADATIGAKSRVALIGPNGAGKSTLIRIVLDLESPDSGAVVKGKYLSIGHLAQEVPKFHGGTVLDEVLRMDGRRKDLVKERTEFEAYFAEAHPDQRPEEEELKLERYGRVLEELEALDEYRLESRAQEILLGVGFKKTDFQRALTELSGGWLMRVALARILLMEPDLLLLDEPTNHLDLESLLWLEEYLQNFRGAMLIVSHDAAFLNRIVREVLEIDQKKLWVYRGNLEAFAIQKSERLEVLKAQYAGQQAKIAEVEKFVSRFGAKATKARQAQSKLKQLEKMERIELPDERSTVRFRFPPAPHSGKEVVTLKGASVQYGAKTVFRDVHWVLRRGTRVAIVGVNGAGKTTLLKLLSGTLNATAGEARLGHEVKVGYYAQIQAESLDMRKTILEELEQVAPEMPMSQVRAIAGAFLFTGDAVEKRCGVLSGGEKARVALAKLLLSPSNFLILDEPTNHLDSDSREVLLEALEDYQGTLVVVSHDREFISPLADSVLEIIPSPEGKGSEVRELLGGYEDYLERKVREVKAQVQQKREVKTKAEGGIGVGGVGGFAEISAKGSLRQGPSNNQIRNWEKERDQLERDIAELEKLQSGLLEKLSDSSNYGDSGQTMKWVAEQTEIQKRLGDRLARWEEVCGLLGG